SADEKRRMTILLVGSLGFFPAFAYYLVAVTVGEIKIPSWASLLLCVSTITFPLYLAYAVVKHRIFGIKVLMRKGLQFFLLSKGVLFFEGVVVFLALFYLAEGIFSRALKWTGPSTLAIATALVTMGSVVGMRRVNRRLMHRIERKFFREAYDARHILTELTRNVRRVAASDPEKLIRTVTSTVVDSLHPDQAAVFLRGTEISRLPLNHRGVQPLLQKTGTDNGGSYYCYWHHAYRHTPSEVEIREACGQNVFPADSFIIRRLEHELAAEEGALEIYLDNPRSWVRSQASGMTSRERALITRWNLRLLVPLSTKKGLCGFLGLGEKLSEEPYSSEDKELLLALAQQMADGLDYAELMLEGQEQAKTAHELEIAKQVQEKLFPQQAVPAAGLDYAGVCRPARVVGGDYYDFIRLDNKKIGIAIGDISGKGVSAALLMASLQATLRSQATAYGQDTAKVVCGINDHLLATTDDNRFATLFYGIFDSSSCVLDYVNCGHNPPIVLRTDPSPQILRLKASTTVLGVVPALSCPSDSIELRAGDVLVLYSDGITEAVNDHDEMFGEERLIEVVSGLDHHPAYEIRDQVIDAVLRFSGDLPPSDDITLIIGKIL
ncbi:MAG: PP2C family protein-serine/threonine phosphatase, partial [Acidobacteriota bacterium]